MAEQARSTDPADGAAAPTGEVDVVIVGAGFSGLYLLKRMRDLGMSTRVLEAGDDVGGTWYWNRYPGARCDIPTTDYTLSFDPALETEWTWSEKYATQPEILRYAQFIATKYDLYSGIDFVTRVEQATWDADAKRWHVRTDRGETIACRYYVMATGCLSLPKIPDIEGHDRFRGEVYFTSRWPHEGVDFTGKRVAVIGTGSSAIQSIPLMAAQADAMTVFQRTPNFSIPAYNGPANEERLAKIAADAAAYRSEAKLSGGGVPGEPTLLSARALTDEERRARFEEVWAVGGLEMLGVFNDIMVNEEANALLCELIREKIRSIVHDPVTAEALCPKDHPFGTKRPCVDTNYYSTFNLPHVRLVDLRSDPITTITDTGIETAGESFEFDAIVFATGFDAMTGALVGVDIVGRDGRTLKDQWAHGPATYLGLTSVGFPNLFMITGPGSPSVLSNMAVSIEQHVDWVTGAIAHLRDVSVAGGADAAEGWATIEPTETAQETWGVHVNDCANITLYPIANSWYMGANVPGKPRMFLPYVGGVGPYRLICDEVVDKGWLGFRIDGPGGTQCNDGKIRELMPDVGMVLTMMATLELPPIESMSAEQAREFMAASSAMRPAGPAVGEIVDGTFPAADGSPLTYRLYRPATEGPHPVVVYFHGGGWVLGDHESDDPFCRDLCVRSNALIVSCNHRHGPEARFPAAVHDGMAALGWVAEHAEELGGIPSRLAVAGWSAGANIAAVAAQLARDAGGPALVGQLLLTPVTDLRMGTQSYVDNGDGYVLTAALMRWFADHYIDVADRTDPLASPLLADDLSGLPPATIITCQFDPLRDEGTAYARALAEAGNEVRHISARGHTHTSLTMVDMIISGAPYREQMGEALRGFFDAMVSR
ncbi:MAG: alpha/beta hydrolase fold domain-containing protein [Actinobacteria bacterium]|nr:alpha/beta hydrolase fold domain-containing protein [Actinomycetota bacterium]